MTTTQHDVQRTIKRLRKEEESEAAFIRKEYVNSPPQLVMLKARLGLDTAA